MIKQIKVISLILCVLIIYTFFGGMAYSALPDRCHAEDEKQLRPEEHCHDGDKIMAAIIWPITMAVWGIGSVGIAIGEFGGQIYDEISQ